MGEGEKEHDTYGAVLVLTCSGLVMQCDAGCSHGCAGIGGWKTLRAELWKGVTYLHDADRELPTCLCLKQSQKAQC